MRFIKLYGVAMHSRFQLRLCTSFILSLLVETCPVRLWRDVFFIFLVVWLSWICRVSLWFPLFGEPWIWTFADVPEWRKANMNNELSHRSDIWSFIVLGFVRPFICIRVSVYGRFSIWWLVLVLDSFPIVNIIWHLFGATVIWLLICLFCRESAWQVL